MKQIKKIEQCARFFLSIFFATQQIVNRAVEIICDCHERFKIAFARAVFPVRNRAYRNVQGFGKHCPRYALFRAQTFQSFRKQNVAHISIIEQNVLLVLTGNIMFRIIYIYKSEDISAKECFTTSSRNLHVIV